MAKVCWQLRTDKGVQTYAVVYVIILEKSARVCSPRGAIQPAALKSRSSITCVVAVTYNASLSYRLFCPTGNLIRLGHMQLCWPRTNYPVINVKYVQHVRQRPITATVEQTNKSRKICRALPSRVVNLPSHNGGEHQRQAQSALAHTG